MLLRRLLLVSLLLSLGLSAISLWSMERVRYRDRELAIERMAATQTTDLARERCEANPNWFLAGPRGPAPSAALLAQPDGDVLAPRPDSDPRPVEFFAYDVEYIGQSTAAPRLPQPMRAALRAGTKSVTAPFETPEGTGVQTAFSTGWSGPCVALLFRMHPPPGQFMERVRIFIYLTAGAFLVLLAIAWPLDRRIRAVGVALRGSARSDYQDPALVYGRDELSSLGFAFNEAAVNIRRLNTDLRGQEADFRRFVTNVTAEVDEPLRASLATGDVAQVTDLALHLSNLLVGARFRDPGIRVTETVEISAVVQSVAREFEPAIRNKGVHLDITQLDPAATLHGDPVFLTQGVRNLMAQALEREAPGGTIIIKVQGSVQGRCSLQVADSGPDLSDADLRELNAVRRFRGDEGRGADLRGDIGLGLAVVHEVCHRFGMRVEFRRGAAGGLEVELSLPI